MIYKLIVFLEIHAVVAYILRMAFASFVLADIQVATTVLVFTLTTMLGFLMKIYNFRDKKSIVKSILIFVVSGLIFYCSTILSTNILDLIHFLNHD